jgi:excisionase family DNA binding protein
VTKTRPYREQTDKISPPLPGHPPLKAGESLDSFLVRLSVHNFYHSPSFLVDLVLGSPDHSPLVKDSLRCPRQIDTFERLSALTQIDCLALYWATAHRFALALVPPDDEIKLFPLQSRNVPLLPKSIAQKQLRPKTGAQFCPACLKLGPYHRLVWLHVAASACLEHSCLLVSSCDRCGKPVQIRDIVEVHCRSCDADLSNAHSVQLTNDFGLLAQHFIQSWLFNTCPKELDSLPPGPPRVLLRVLEGLRFAAQSFIVSEIPYLHILDDRHAALASPCNVGSSVLTPYQSYCVYTTAFKGLVDWPRGFYSFLDAQLAEPCAERRVKSVFGEIGSLYVNWLQHNWQHEAFDFVQKAFDDYLAERFEISRSILGSDRFRHNSSVKRGTNYVSESYASRLLEALPSTVQGLVASGDLAPYYTCGDKAFAFFKEADVLTLRGSWLSLVRLDQVAKTVGVSEEGILDMVINGIVSVQPSPGGGETPWKFGQVSAIEFVEKVKNHTEIYTASFTPFSLAGAAQILAVVGLDAASVILRVAEGRLGAYREASKPFACQNLLFSPTDLYHYIEVVKAENGWIEREQARKMLDISNTTLAIWISSGLLAPAATHANVQYFDRSEVERFVVDYITSDEAAKLLGIKRQTVRKWVHQGRLEAVSGPEIDDCHTYRFEREYLLRWQQASTLST